MKLSFIKVLVLIPIALLAACGSIQNVQPWEKGNLAKKEMTFDFSNVNPDSDYACNYACVYSV